MVSIIQGNVECIRILSNLKDLLDSAKCIISTETQTTDHLAQCIDELLHDSNMYDKFLPSFMNRQMKLGHSLCFMTVTVT